MKIKKIIKAIYRGTVILLTAIIIAIILRVLVFSSFKIPTPSMEPAVLSGDYIIVNKLIIGPRLFRNFKFLNGEKVETIRLPGLRKIRRNDVLVFNYPYSEGNKLSIDLNVYYLKRCVAVPGDSFYIENGFYKVTGSNNKLGNYENQLALSRKAKKDFPPIIFNCFPYKENLDWNLKNFGPLYIPKAGDYLSIDINNICFYKNLIEYETDKNITIDKSTIFLEGKVIKSYCFKKNYYMMTGDFVLDSRDSRYWGLLPEDHIVGKAVLIWKSIDPITKKTRLNRILKRIL
jgi:signal peptidase I